MSEITRTAPARIPDGWWTGIASSSAALVAFGISGSVDWGAALLVFTGAAFGAVIGARAATLLPERMLSAAFAAVLVVAGIRMML